MDNIPKELLSNRYNINKMHVCYQVHEFCNIYPPVSLKNRLLLSHGDQQYDTIKVNL
jgi:hypothetical protein